jgi:hypothetical protein
MATERSPDRLAQRLGAVNDEQAADRWVQAAPDRVIEQRLHGLGVLGGAFDHAERMLALQDLEAHSNGTRQDHIGRETISDAQGKNPWQPVVRELENDKDDQPDREDSQSDDQQALQ